MSGNAFALMWHNPYVRVLAFLGLTLRDLAYILALAVLAHPLLRWLEGRRVPRG